MDGKDIGDWEAAILGWLREHAPRGDPAHDLGHLLRVWRMARALAEGEGGADLLVVLAASLLHDVLNLPKGRPDRPRASCMAAERAVGILRGMGFPGDRLDAVAHAIEAHSFSAGIEPRSAEARIVQDADRLEALGAVGIARCFAISGLMGRQIADTEDPLAEGRPLDDVRFALDHFEAKLLRLPGTMRTEAGRRVARERAAFLAAFRQRLAAEIRGGA